MEELILLGLRCESKKSVKVKHACNILDNTYQNGKKIVQKIIFLKQQYILKFFCHFRETK